MQRGLSARFEALERAHPRRHRALALAGLTVFSLGVCIGQIISPGFVDPAIVQLVQLSQVFFIAIVQSLLLRHRLPWQLWLAAAVTLGGSAMVVAPNISQSSAGSLGTTRGWIGFGLSVVTVMSGGLCLVLMQATRHMGFTIQELQYWYLAVACVLLTAITLPLDGTDWGVMAAYWSAADWLVLALLGSVVFVGLAFALQHAVWQLGAPTVSLMAGQRLVSAIVLSRLILGTSAVQTGLQIAGIAVTIASVTAFMWWSFRQAQRRQASTPGAATEVPPKSAPSSIEEAAIGGKEGNESSNASAGLKA
ncbi:hypothetical protein COHA_000130 [Chlorella ohadii]|uniref:Uncharacterized protein n=1 Tax=Chlorella ohadii TaxID=2649997 RepID=A0AAD5E1K5_9CHLO|nr:hypothetical protein COHA_000130 [Chlorella ohadii]